MGYIYKDMKQPNIKPKNQKKEDEEYTLEDKDYLLIEAIRELSRQIGRLASK